MSGLNRQGRCVLTCHSLISESAYWSASACSRQRRSFRLSYRLVDGKEYFARAEVLALAAVLRAIDNPADRLSLVQALRSPFFAVSDADLLHFVSTGGVAKRVERGPSGSDADEHIICQQSVGRKQRLPRPPPGFRHNRTLAHGPHVRWKQQQGPKHLGHQLLGAG